MLGLPFFRFSRGTEKKSRGVDGFFTRRPVSSLVDWYFGGFLHSWTHCRIKPVFFNSEKVSCSFLGNSLGRISKKIKYFLLDSSYPRTLDSLFLHEKTPDFLIDPWCFENSTEPIYPRYRVSVLEFPGDFSWVFWKKTPRIRWNTHTIENGLRTWDLFPRGDGSVFIKTENLDRHQIA